MEFLCPNGAEEWLYVLNFLLPTICLENDCSSFFILNSTSNVYSPTNFIMLSLTCWIRVSTRLRILYEDKVSFFVSASVFYPINWLVLVVWILAKGWYLLAFDIYFGLPGRADLGFTLLTCNSKLLAYFCS